MILPFSTQINGKPTYFVEKIWKGLKTQSPESYIKLWATVSPEETTKQFPVDIDIYNEVKPKLHTIREDKKDRWKPGVMIDFFINARQKNMFRFAPRIPVVSTQEIRIKYTESSSNTPLIYIEVFGKNDYKCLDTFNPKTKQSSFKLIEKLAINDGFDSVEDFFAYFNKDFTGKIIHWTDLRY